MSGSVNLTTSTGLLLNLRLLLEADLPAVMQLERAAHSHPWRQSSFEDCLRGRQRRWLAEYKGVLVGYVVVAHGGGDAEVLNIAVAPGVWREGIGSSLVQDAGNCLKDAAAM